MMLTEDEAKKKVCCGPPGTSIDQKPNEVAACLGSACMAWRWWSRSYPHEPSTPAVEEIRKNDKGFCGLAGEPA